MTGLISFFTILSISHHAQSYTPSSDIFCDLASKQKERPLRVAVIDTGADIDHPALSSVIWKNKGEQGVDAQGQDKSHNGIDDDGNSYIDDVSGWDFVHHSPNVTDHLGHGTHITGLVTDAQRHNKKHKTQVMVLKYFDRGVSFTESGASFQEALSYSLKMQADVLQISGGGYYFSLRERELLQEALKKSVLVVAAGGNKKPQQDNRSFFPAAYGLRNIQSVAATNEKGVLLATSNINPLQPPALINGYEIKSTLPGGKWGRLTGSSQAAAVFTNQVLTNPEKFCAQSLWVSRKNRKLMAANLQSKRL